MSATRYQLFGRSASHYTRLVRIVAHEAGVDLSFRPISSLKSQDPADYGGHPGLKMPTLYDGETHIFGSIEICRRLVAASPKGLAVAWPEALPLDLRNAWELLSQAMQAQVQLAFGVAVCGLPADHIYFSKAQRGLEGALDWIEARLPDLLAAEPAADLSLFQATIFCLMEHLVFRPTYQPRRRPALEAVRDAFGARTSATATPYGLDPGTWA